MPVNYYYLLQEDGSYVLQEDDSQIIISSQTVSASCYSVTLTYTGPATGRSQGSSGCCDSSYDTGTLATGESVDNIILANPYLLMPDFEPSNIVPYECPTPTPTTTPTPTLTPTPTPTPLPPDVPPSTAVTPYNLGLTSETTIYVNEVKCRVLENDFNYSQNPTVFKNTTYITGALAMPFYGPEGGQAQVGIITDGTIADNLTGSAFNPYATTIGLFSPANELLVVGKFATPYPIPENTDITFIVRWDS